MARSAAKPDLDALRRFSKLTDREATPYFGGRTDEIDLVESALERIRDRTQEGHWRPSGGETILFQGAPGAGKSALLHHLVRQWRSAGPNAPAVVDTEASHYVNESKLALHVAEEAFDSALSAQFRRSVTTLSGATTSLSGGVPGVATGTGATESGRHEATAPTAPTLAAIKRALSGTGRTIVLVLDEAQVLESFDADSTRPLITGLHMGSHGGPILPVFAGLAHSGTVFQDRGISRFSRGHDRTLAALSVGDAVETVHLMLAECRVLGDQETKRQWAHALANESCGWPQHLHVSMQALASELLAASTPGRLEAVDSDFGVAVLRESASARDEYYERRIDEPLAGARRLVAETFQRIGDGATRDEVLVHIRAAARPGGGSDALPRHHDEAMLLDRMIRRGLLQLTPKKMLACPIPSFREYIERTAMDTAPET